MVTLTLFPFFFFFFSPFCSSIKDPPLFLSERHSGERAAGTFTELARDRPRRQPELAGPDDPATVASVEEFLSAMSDIPAVAMDQDTAELTLSDIVETLSTHAEDGDWDWVVSSAGRWPRQPFSLRMLGEMTSSMASVRGVLAFEAAQVALGDKRALDVVANSPLIVRLFVLKFESMPQGCVPALRLPLLRFTT